MLDFQIGIQRGIYRGSIRGNIYCSGQTHAYVRDERLGRGGILKEALGRCSLYDDHLFRKQFSVER